MNEEDDDYGNVDYDVGEAVYTRGGGNDSDLPLDVNQITSNVEIKKQNEQDDNMEFTINNNNSSSIYNNYGNNIIDQIIEAKQDDEETILFSNVTLSSTPPTTTTTTTTTSNNKRISQSLESSNVFYKSSSSDSLNSNQSLGYGPTIAILPDDFNSPPLINSSSNSTNSSSNNSNSNSRKELPPLPPLPSNNNQNNNNNNNNNNNSTENQRHTGSHQRSFSTSSTTSTTNNNNNNKDQKSSFIQRIFRRDTSKTNVIEPLNTSQNNINVPQSPKENNNNQNNNNQNNNNNNNGNGNEGSFFSTFSNLLNSTSNNILSSKSAPSTPQMDKKQSMDIETSKSITPLVLNNNKLNNNDKTKKESSPELKKEEEILNISIGGQPLNSSSLTTSPSYNHLGDVTDFNQLVELNEPFSYELFLEKLEHVTHIKASIDSFVGKLKNRKGLANDDLREALMDFVSNMMHSLESDERWSSASQEELTYTSYHLQQYVIEKIYDYVFRATDAEINKDNKLSDLINKLAWIQPSHLEIEIPSSSTTSSSFTSTSSSTTTTMQDIESMEEMWTEAGQFLVKINTTKSCRHKQMYIVKCCKFILSYLGRVGGTHGADSLIPHLIWVVLKTNPPYLNSNVYFIGKFSDSSDSEALYYMTQLVAVIYFIENIKAESLKIEKKEFNRLMGGSGNSSNQPSPIKRDISSSLFNSQNNDIVVDGGNSVNTSFGSSNGNGNESPPFARSTLFDDSALATLAEMFPDCDTQYLIDCINYIDTKHKHKIPPPKEPLTPSELVSRVTNMIAEHQGYLQVDQSSPTLMKKKKTIPNKKLPSIPTNRSNSSSSGSEGDIMNQSLSNSNEYSGFISNGLQPSNTLLLQQLLDQKEDEIAQLQITMKSQLQTINHLNQKIKQQQLNTSNHQFTFAKSNYNDLKLSDLPLLFEEYKKMYNIINNSK